METITTVELSKAKCEWKKKQNEKLSDKLIWCAHINDWFTSFGNMLFWTKKITVKLLEGARLAF